LKCSISNSAILDANSEINRALERTSSVSFLRSLSRVNTA